MKQPRSMKTAILSRIAATLSSAALTLTATAQKTDVLTQHNDLARTGTNLHETILTPATVNANRFGLLFKRDLDDQLYTQPLYVSGVSISGGTHDVVYITTVNNSVYAFDANDPAASTPLWHINFGLPANLHDADFGCSDINGNMGIIGTPVIDRAAGALYVVALTKAGGRYIQRLHALDLATGADLPNSPVEIKAKGFNPLMQNQRPGLLLENGNIYVGYASHCDAGPYHGYLIAYDAGSLSQTAVFNTSPTGDGASIWQSGQAPAADASGNIYVVSGNGTWDGKINFSESFLKLDPELRLLDWFTPTNHFKLDEEDNDLNSSGATLVPGAAPGTTLVLGGGKSGKLYILNSEHFGHLGDEHALQHFQATSSHLHSIVYWDSARRGRLLYIWGQRDRERVYKFEGDKLDEKPVHVLTKPNEGHPGAMLSLSANGNKDGILWAAIHATGDSWHESRPGILHAYDADNIEHELWNSWENKQRDYCGNYSKMAPPTIANGKVYLPSFGTQNSRSGSLCVYGLLLGGNPPEAPMDVHATADKNGVVTVTWSSVPGATYRLQATTTVDGVQDGPARLLAAGLTEPKFIQTIPAMGSTRYTVMAVDENGASTESVSAAVTLRPPD